jgi:hypothetical protein
LPYYQRAKVYAQLSISEGLPNVVCEAMLAGDIPVGTRRGGIPEAIGNTGFYVPYGDVQASAEAIKRALQSPEELGLKARARIMQLYPQQRREEALINIINIAVLMKYSSILQKSVPATELNVDIAQSPSSSLEITIDMGKRSRIPLFGR